MNWYGFICACNIVVIDLGYVIQYAFETTSNSRGFACRLISHTCLRLRVEVLAVALVVDLLYVPVYTCDTIIKQ